MREVIMHRISKILLIALLMPTLILAGDLFFSEYIEASVGFNKAIEIYNPTESPIDLSHYVIKAANHGSSTKDGIDSDWGYFIDDDKIAKADTRYVLPLSGTLNAGDVYVIYHNSAVDAIKSVGDIGFSYNGTPNGGDGDNVVNFNGDDALGLFKDGVLIDVIGEPIPDPGTGWDVAGVTKATADHTLVRKSTIGQGNTDWSASAGTNDDNSEWIVYADQTYSYLGAHVYEGGANIPPTARAGIDQVVRFNDTVTLDGSASNDQDGSIASYAWTQVSGTAVTLSATNQAVVTFTSPSSIAILVFELVVTDDESAVGKDSVTIYVDPSEIIISEYVEGSSNNKYIELYNASDATIDLNTNGYDLRLASNGGGSFIATFSDWGTFSQLASGGVIVLGKISTGIYPNVNIIDEDVINFNGNDAVGLFRNGLLVDVVGDPNRSDSIIIDVTLRRKNTVMYGSSTYIPGEWIEYEKDNVDNLGSHSSNPNAPVITDISYEPEFVTSADEITVSATITAVEGEIDSARIFYGASGSLINEAEMWNEEGDTYMGLIPSGQTGNSIIQFYIYAADNASNTGQSASQSVIIANSTPETVANIHTNFSTLDGQLVTIKGIVTIGANVLSNSYTSAYIQDEFGRGLNLYNYAMDTNITRGDELMVVGYVDKYITTVELTDFIYKEISSGNELPVAQSVSVAGANSSDWEGTLIEFSGQVVKKTATYTTDPVVYTGTDISVVTGIDTTIARIVSATGIDTSTIVIGSSYTFMGVGSKFKTTYQTLIGYAEDITDLVGIKEEPAPKALAFNLSPAYPNPFNPATTISWELDKNSAFEVAVFNILGQKIDVIASGHANAGRYSKVWDASKFTSGVYFVQLQAGNRVKTQKMLYLK